MAKEFLKFYDKKITSSINLKKKLKDKIFKNKIKKSIEKIEKTIVNGGKIYLCGNGGSAADAQHLAAEFLIRLRPKVNRKPIAAISLALDSSTITACSNDFSYRYIFSRNLEALASEKDILIAISTSGNSQNILEVLKVAKRKKIFSITLLGNNGGKAKKLADLNIIVPSKITAQIQECHIFLGHLIFESVEDNLIDNNYLHI